MHPREELGPFVARMAPVLQTAFERLAKVSFRPDPIGGVKYARATSIIGSAYKRHGQILGRALLERLKDCGKYTVWTEECFKLSSGAITEGMKGLPPQAYRKIDLPYGEQVQNIPIDLLTYEATIKRIRSYNVKRGNGAYDAGKRRLIFDELLRTQMLLTNYGRFLGLSVERSEAYIVFYYGLRSIPKPYSLVSGDLDEHFGFPVVVAIEAVNEIYRTGLYSLIENTPMQ